MSAEIELSEISVNDLLSVDQAIAILDAVSVHPSPIQLPLLNAANLFLAEDIFSDRDYPPFDKSTMDGFAVRAADASIVDARLLVIDTVAAGQVGDRSIGPGEAIAIMTGAPLPPGADAVVVIERTSRDGRHIVVHQPARPNQSIARRGTDTKVDQLLLPKGTRLGPAQMAVAASVGLANISVFARPSVALLSTGDELIDIDQKPAGSQIRNSNGPMLHALLQRLGCDVINLGIVRDNRDELRSAIQQGLKADALFISGGMSMGERDFVPGLLQELGLTLKISKLRIKPGKPFAFAIDERLQNGRTAMAFGLPGNPVSSFVCTIRLAARVLRRMAGSSPDTQLNHAKLIRDMSANGPRELYLPAVLHGANIDPLDPNGSADLFTLARANSLLIRPENAAAAKSGDTVQFFSI